MSRFGWACAIALALTAVELGAKAADHIRLSGCVVRAEDGDGFLLTNVPGEAAWLRSGNGAVVPGPVGTSGSVATIFYWLDEDDELQDHIGHRVEVEGELQGDLKDGEIDIDRKDNWTELEIESDGRSLKARVPHSAFIRAAGGRDDEKMNVLVRKVDAKQVRMIAANCNG